MVAGWMILLPSRQRNELFTEMDQGQSSRSEYYQTVEKSGSMSKLGIMLVLLLFIGNWASKKITTSLHDTWQLLLIRLNLAQDQ